VAAPNPLAPGSDSQFHTCPVCGGKMEVVYNRHSQTVSVCIDCHAGITIPTSAWEVARTKKEQHYPKPAK